jgi:hypothetical protein
MDNDNRGTSELSLTGEALEEQREWLRVTLSCIGDAVMRSRSTFIKNNGQ